MSTRSREFTGRHMLAIMLGFFGVIIAVNVTMATFARTSWSGFVVRNSYVASQQFNDRVAAARAQQALGWSVRLTVVEGAARVSLADREGNPVALDAARLEFRSPASDADDGLVDFADTDGAFEARLPLADGLWVLAIRLRTSDGVEWMDTRRILMRAGSLR